MKLFRFPGGIHPEEKKQATAASPVQIVPLPNEATVPLGQHIGKPAKPIVDPGKPLKTGEKIGIADGYISAAIHSPVTGTVKSVSAVPYPAGGLGPAITIEVNKNEEWELLPKHTDWREITAPILIETIQAAGIVGLGGATFPTAVKLSPPPGIEINTLIINGAECEPLLTADDRLMIEHAAEIAEGINILKHILGVKRAIVGIEENKPEAVERLCQAAAGSFEVVPLSTRYPQGGEKQLIFALLGREVPSGKLPLAVGVVVQNVGTAFAIREAIVSGKPLVERIVTVTGGALVTPGNFRVRVGTSLRHLFELAGGDEKQLRKVVLGGPMMGRAITGLDFPVTKGTSGVLFLTSDEVALTRQYPCINCGRCGQVCPMNLLPRRLEIFTDNNEINEIKKENALDCMECGSCSYICPAKRELVQKIQLGKRMIWEAERQ